MLQRESLYQVKRISIIAIAIISGIFILNESQNQRQTADLPGYVIPAFSLCEDIENLAEFIMWQTASKGEVEFDGVFSLYAVTFAGEDAVWISRPGWSRDIRLHVGENYTIYSDDNTDDYLIVFKEIRNGEFSIEIRSNCEKKPSLIVTPSGR